MTTGGDRNVSHSKPQCSTRSQMRHDDKQPGGVHWATVALVLALVAYPLSFGPAVWIHKQTGRSERLGDLMIKAWEPLDWVCRRSPKVVVDATHDYLNWWRQLPPRR